MTAQDELRQANLKLCADVYMALGKDVVKLHKAWEKASGINASLHYVGDATYESALAHMRADLALAAYKAANQVRVDYYNTYIKNSSI